MEYMTPREFKEGGYLQEANRLFFHPLGLALAINSDDELDDDNYFRVQVWDDRGDPEGWFFGDLTDEDSVERADKVYMEAHAKTRVRTDALAEVKQTPDLTPPPVIQPIGTRFSPIEGNVVEESDD